MECFLGAYEATGFDLGIPRQPVAFKGVQSARVAMPCDKLGFNPT